MNYKIKNNNLLIEIIGRIDTTTKDIIEKDINEIINQNKFESLTFDFDKVEYISSIGLRMLLNYKKEYNNVNIINVSLEVYDVFEVTGFNKIMNIHKRFREVSIEGCQKIGEGAVGIVYQLTPDQIIKVFKYEFSLEDIEKEIECGRKAFVLGIPTAISFDVVKVNGNYGLVFELLKSHSVGKQLVNKQMTIDEFIPIYAELFKELHSIDVPDGYFPPVLERYLYKLDTYTKQYLTNEEYEKLRNMFINTKDNHHVVHGDCHIKNIMLSEDKKPILIDMETLAVGSRVFDFSGIHCSYIMFQETDRKNGEEFFGIKQEELEKLYYGMMQLVFKDKNYQEAIDKITIAASVLQISYVYMYEEGKNERRINNAVNHIKELLPLYDNLDLE